MPVGADARALALAVIDHEPAFPFADRAVCLGSLAGRSLLALGQVRAPGLLVGQDRAEERRVEVGLFEPFHGVVDERSYLRLTIAAQELGCLGSLLLGEGVSLVAKELMKVAHELERPRVQGLSSHPLARCRVLSV